MTQIGARSSVAGRRATRLEGGARRAQAADGARRATNRRFLSRMQTTHAHLAFVSFSLFHSLCRRWPSTMPNCTTRRTLSAYDSIVVKLRRRSSHLSSPQSITKKTAPPQEIVALGVAPRAIYSPGVADSLYKVGEELGRGGCGIVYKCTSRSSSEVWPALLGLARSGVDMILFFLPVVCAQTHSEERL